MILAGKVEKAFPRGAATKKKPSDSSAESIKKKLKEVDENLFSTKKVSTKKSAKSDSERSKKKAKKGEKKAGEEVDILAVKQVSDT
jgi:hypothetical protein